MDFITDTEAEHRVVSSMLHSEAACIETISRIDAEDFSDPMARQVFIMAGSLYRRGIKPSYVEVIKEGGALGLFENLENRQHLTYIVEQYINDENVGYWITKVIQASKGRKAQRLLNAYTEKLNGSRRNIDIQEFIGQVGGDFFALAMDAESEKIESGRDMANMGCDLVSENVERWRKMQDDARVFGFIALEGVTTGFNKLDNLTLGYKPGDLIILGAQTGHGKTAFALNSIRAACLEAGNRALYINTEMSRRQIAYRWGAILAGLPLQKIRTGSLSNEELSEVINAYGRLSESGFYTSYMPNLTPDKLQILAQKAKIQYNIKLLILDYVGRMEKRDPKLQEWQILEDIVKACKVMAQNLDLASMILVQLNEDGSLQGAKRMKNECDLMLKLVPLASDGDEDTRKNQQEKFERKYNRVYEKFNYRLWLDKSRDSEAGLSIPLVFDQSIQQIREAEDVGRYVS